VNTSRALVFSNRHNFSFGLGRPGPGATGFFGSNNQGDKGFGQYLHVGRVRWQYRRFRWADEWKNWGTGFIKTDIWLQTIHTSLSKK